MIIKKFQGKTENEAVENAKKELGDDVVIMNVRNVKRKGPFSFLMPQLVEVTVALEEESERMPAPRKDVISQPLVEAIAAVSRTQTQTQTQTQIQPQPQAQPQTAGSRFNVVSEPEAPAREGPRQESSAIEEKLDSLHSLLEQQLQKPEEKEADSETEKENEPESEVSRFIKLLYNTMLDNEVDETYANQIVDEIEKISKPNMPFDYALASTYQKMILKFDKPAEISVAKKGSKVVFFVGPTGVGKTTTIAKLASKFSVENGKKVALLTADTYRIAAAEQLRTYANILEVPFRVIYSTEEMEQSLTDFKDYDFILVDTAGHSHHNEAQRDTMNGFIHSLDGMVEKDVFLVLSATTKYRDLLSIADTYSAMTDYKLIFTKLDETTALGNLLNLKLHTGAALSYVTFGQNVPDDIEHFNPQKTVKQLLGGRKN